MTPASEITLLIVAAILVIGFFLSALRGVLPRWQAPHRISLRLLFAPVIMAASFLLIIAIPVMFLLSFVWRRRCPHCARRGVRVGPMPRCHANPELTGDPRPFFISDCKYCHYQFLRFEHQSVLVQIAPEDPRYVRAT